MRISTSSSGIGSHRDHVSNPRSRSDSVSGLKALSVTHCRALWWRTPLISQIPVAMQLDGRRMHSSILTVTRGPRNTSKESEYHRNRTLSVSRSSRSDTLHLKRSTCHIFLNSNTRRGCISNLFRLVWLGAGFLLSLVPDRASPFTPT